jgi:hypothetical protein
MNGRISRQFLIERASQDFDERLAHGLTRRVASRDGVP